MIFLTGLVVDSSNKNSRGYYKVQTRTLLVKIYNCSEKYKLVKTYCSITGQVGLLEFVFKIYLGITYTNNKYPHLPCTIIFVSASSNA